MALSITDHRIVALMDETINWIMERDHASSKIIVSPLIALSWYWPGPTLVQNPIAILFVRKGKTSVPFMQFVLTFACLQFQIVVPGFRLDEMIREKEIEIYRFPPPVPKDWQYGAPTASSIDLSSKTCKVNESIKCTLSFGEITKNRPNPNGNNSSE
jgi:hypothetical protein